MDTIFRIVRRESPYVQIDKKVVEDVRLSWKAKGLMAYLLSRPPEWWINIPDIVNRSTDSKTAVYSALDELKSLGYVYFKGVREAGRFSSGIWFVYEDPLTNPDFSPHSGFPDTVKPGMENQPVLIRNELIRTESNNNPEAGGLSTPVSDKPKKPRNELIDTLAEIDGQNPLSVTQSNWSRYAKVLKEIKAVSPAVARPELLRRAANYRTKWPDRQLTATALGKWWGALDSGRPDGPPVRTSVRVGVIPHSQSHPAIEPQSSCELNFEEPDFS